MAEPPYGDKRSTKPAAMISAIPKPATHKPFQGLRFFSRRSSFIDATHVFGARGTVIVRAISSAAMLAGQS